MPDALVIRGGRVLDETGERMADVLVRDGVIVDVGPGLEHPAGARVLDAEACVVTPGLVDIQVHFREPGREEAETIETGARGAALGGFHRGGRDAEHHAAARRRQGRRRGAREGRQVSCLVTVAGCITQGRAGHELAPLGELYDLGVRIFTDDGDCVADANVMRRAFEYARALPGAVIAQHAEDPDLVAGGHMHEGEWSAKLGIPGRPAEAESTIVARDLALAAHRWPLPRAAPVDRRASRAGPRGQGRGYPGDLRGLATAPRADRRGVRPASTRCSR